jgi:hypothetical protein
MWLCLAELPVTVVIVPNAQRRASSVKDQTKFLFPCATRCRIVPEMT